MTSTIIKKKVYNGYIYETDFNYIGKANYTFSIAYRRLYVLSKDGKVVLSAKQHGIWEKITSIFPILQLRNFLYIRERCSFSIYENSDKKIGEITYLEKYKFRIVINNIFYIIEFQSENIVSLYREGKKIIEIERDYVQGIKKTKYYLTTFDEEDNANTLLWTIFSDLILFESPESFFGFGPKIAFK